MVPTITALPGPLQAGGRSVPRFFSRQRFTRSRLRRAARSAGVSKVGEWGIESGLPGAAAATDAGPGSDGCHETVERAAGKATDEPTDKGDEMVVHGEAPSSGNGIAPSQLAGRSEVNRYQ